MVETAAGKCTDVEKACECEMAGELCSADVEAYVRRFFRRLTLAASTQGMLPSAVAGLGRGRRWRIHRATDGRPALH